MAKISVSKDTINNLTPQEIEALPYPQHLIDDFLKIKEGKEAQFVTPRDFNDAYVQVPTNDYMPCPDDDMYTIAEWSDHQSDSDSHNTFASLEFPRDIDDIPYEVIEKEIENFTKTVDILLEYSTHQQYIQSKSSYYY